jgi:hypothetical protein
MNKKTSDVVGFIVERFRNNWSLEVTNPIVAVWLKIVKARIFWNKIETLYLKESG